MADTPERFEPNDYVGLIRDALHPDERKFFKSYLGQESPDFMDYIVPDTSRLKRFDEARKVRAHIYESVISESMKPRATYNEAKAMFPGAPWGDQAGQGQPGQPSQPGMVPGPVGPTTMLAPPGQLPGYNQNNLPQGIPGGQRLPSTPHMGMLAEPQQGYPNEPTDQAAGIVPPGIPQAGMPIERQSVPVGGFNQAEQTMVPQTREARGMPGPVPPGGGDELIPRTYQNLLDAKIHREGLRGLYGGRQSSQMQMFDHYKALKSGQVEEAYQGETQTVEDMLLHSKGAATGSLEGQNKQADLDKKQALLPTVGKQAEANLANTQARTADTQANTETENLLRDARYAKLTAQTTLAQKQAELAGNMSGSERMKQKAIMLNVLKYGVAQGEFDLNDEKEFMNYIMGGTGLEVGAEPPGKFKAFLDSMGITTPGPSGLKVNPKGPASGTSKSQSFEGAPAGKAVGDILKNGGKPVAKWDGKAWQPITQ